MGRSRLDGALWARIARRGGADPSVAGVDADFLPLTADGTALVVTGAGAAASATALRIAHGDPALAEADVIGRRLSVADQHVQPLTDAQLRATAVPVATGMTQPLTDAQLRATRVPVDTALTQPLTDTQLRAAAVPVAGPLTDAQLRATAVPVSGPLTDAEIRATPLNVITQVDARTLLVLADATYTVSGASAALPTDTLTRVAVDLMVTAVSGVAPEIRFVLDRLGADGRWYPIWTSAATTAPTTLSTTVGQGMTVAQSLAASIRLRWEITGTTPSFTFGGGIVGK